MIYYEDILAVVKENLSDELLQSRKWLIRLYQDLNVGEYKRTTTLWCPFCKNTFKTNENRTIYSECEMCHHSALIRYSFSTEYMVVAYKATIKEKDGIVLAGIKTIWDVHILENHEVTDNGVTGEITWIAFCEDEKATKFKKVANGLEGFVKTSSSFATLFNRDKLVEGCELVDTKFGNHSPSNIDLYYQSRKKKRDAAKAPKNIDLKLPEVVTREPILPKASFHSFATQYDYANHKTLYHTKCDKCGFDSINVSYNRCPNCGNNNMDDVLHAVKINKVDSTIYISCWEKIDEKVTLFQIALIDTETGDLKMYSLKEHKKLSPNKWFDKAPYRSLIYFEPDDSDFKYCGVEVLIEKDYGLSVLINYILDWNHNHSMEQLIKAGYDQTYDCYKEHLNLEGKNLFEILKLNKHYAKFYKEQATITYYCNFVDLQKLCKLAPDISIETIEFLFANSIVNIACKTYEEFNIPIKKTCEYMESVRIYQCYPPRNAALDWYDYLVCSKKIGADMNDKTVKYPNSLKREHDRASFKYDQIKKAMKNEIFVDSVKMYKTLEYKNDNFFIKVPDSLEELFEEGRKLSHCVGSYADRIADGESRILFIRKKDEPDKPFFTVEVSSDMDRIVQIRGFGNKAMRPKDLDEFIKKWKQEKCLRA